MSLHTYAEVNAERLLTWGKTANPTVRAIAAAAAGKGDKS